VTETFRSSPQHILEPGRELSITGDRDRVEGRSIVVLMSQEPSTHMDAGGTHPTRRRWEEGMPQGSTIGYAAWPSERNESHEEQKG
jgi:hypothetical protein